VLAASRNWTAVDLAADDTDSAVAPAAELAGGRWAAR
jgi:hypothetical protein